MTPTRAQAQYERQKRRPPLPRAAPPVAGHIHWARQLLRRIELPMRECAPAPPDQASQTWTNPCMRDVIPPKQCWEVGFVIGLFVFARADYKSSSCREVSSMQRSYMLLSKFAQ